MTKILRHYRLSKETDTLIKAEAVRLGRSEADVITMAIVGWCDAAAEIPSTEKAATAKIIESPAQVPSMVKKVSRKARVVQERASADVTAQAVGRDDIDYADTESTPSVPVALPRLMKRTDREPKIDAWRARGIRQKGDKTR